MTVPVPAELQPELAVPYVEGAERIVAIQGGGYWPTLLRLADRSLAAVVRGGSPRRVVLARDTMTLRGKHWGDCGYPSTVQMDDGTIVTMYYRLGSTALSPRQQELCRQYERDEFERPPASEDMRRFEEAVCVRYREEDLPRG